MDFAGYPGELPLIATFRPHHGTSLILNIKTKQYMLEKL